jgi:hypothetical protein
MNTLMKLALAAALPAVVAAQAPRFHPASDPAAVALFQGHIKATGGDRPPAFLHSILETQIPNGPAMRIESYSAQPDRVLMRSIMDGVLVLEVGFDGEKGWSTSPQMGVAPLDGKDLEQMLAGFGASKTPVIDSSARLTLLPRRTFEDQLVDVVLSVGAMGDSTEVFFAVASGLMVGGASRIPAGAVPGMSPDGAPTVSTMSFRDYRLVAGRQVSFTMVTRMGDMEIVARTIHLDHEPIAPEKFRMPSAPR